MKAFVDWTPRREKVSRGAEKRTVQHYGHPNCTHPSGRLTELRLPTMRVVNCGQCGLEVRYETQQPRVAFPKATVA